MQPAQLEHSFVIGYSPPEHCPCRKNLMVDYYTTVRSHVMCENIMEMEINSDTALQKLNQYMLFSLTYTPALYMFNHPTMECTKGKQLAVYPPRNSCKMSESIGTRTHRAVPRCLPVERREEGWTDPGGKTYDLTFQRVPNWLLQTSEQQHKKKVQIQSWETAHVRVLRGHAHACQRVAICWSTVGTHGTASTVN